MVSEKKEEKRNDGLTLAFGSGSFEASVAVTGEHGHGIYAGGIVVAVVTAHRTLVDICREQRVN